MPRSTYEGDSPLSSSHHQVVYVDGACSHNGTPRARAGYGGYFGSSHDARNFALPVPATEAQTNNRGEMRAVIHCIVQGFVDAGAPKEALDVSHCVTPDWRVSELARPLRRLVIHTDSRYVIDGLTRYSVKWMANGFKLATKEPVLNQDLWKQLIRLRDAYNTCYAQQQHAIESSHPYAFTRESLTSPPKRFHTHNTCNDETEGIELRHVKGHSKDYGNEMADMLAVRGSRMHDSWR
ncbi:putative ribonuclease H1 [Leptomonas pyrrhocoris]|uniref:ribonuclease H n=1 Tax=Leptomonas pyrrhocoris TaxID=157538 RepID=A0A0N0DY13_LEPPY|nr:putative ribonuclease H1 [Leptomonas pyrrhocoris]KPA83615.1 putative ribonuclease H1 [Leptomonas pyrrhocoris]|eukprot:XP_015662054.1 putative ribonuclease H1 [Leptomonas pyrrhocoris]